MKPFSGIAIIATLFAAMVAATAMAQDAIDWYTVDGGGATFSTGGGFQLGGTIGQPDAGSFTAPMSGGGFELVGGFWGAATSVCSCPGDLDSDGMLTGSDIQLFINCHFSPGPSCGCADYNGNSTLDTGDIMDFVSALLNAATCP